MENWFELWDCNQHCHRFGQDQEHQSCGILATSIMKNENISTNIHLYIYNMHSPVLVQLAYIRVLRLVQLVLGRYMRPLLGAQCRMWQAPAQQVLASAHLQPAGAQPMEAPACPNIQPVFVKKMYIMHYSLFSTD